LAIAPVNIDGHWHYLHVRSNQLTGVEGKDIEAAGSPVSLLMEVAP
jgi:hypothetical protein